MSDKSLQQPSGQAKHTVVEFPTAPQSSPEYSQVLKKLYGAAVNGNWSTAEPFLEKLPDSAVSTPISKRGDTLLHIAAAANHTDFAKQLINKMSEEALALKNENQNTAFFFVAASGNVELAEAMMEKNPTLATTVGNMDVLPIHIAAGYGRREMVLYLNQVAPVEKDVAIKVLDALLDINLYDVALEFLDEHTRSAPEVANENPARRPKMYSCFGNESEQGIWERCIKICSGNNVVQNKTYVEKEVTLACLWKKIIMLDYKEIEKKFENIIFFAAKEGNVKLLTMLIHVNPDLIWKHDDKKRTIFHIAVLNRQEDILKLIFEIGSIKDFIAGYEEKKSGNNMLHMAGLLPPLKRLNIVPGAALQMQRELLWFEKVKEIMQPLKAETENNQKGETPGELFTKTHTGLMLQGEKWMKDTANSCMLVAALVATVAFTAAFTVPGGNKDQTGTPIFLESVSFQFFAMSDAISLLSSCTSILMFLSILTSRYAEEDFLWKLPAKLIFGIGTLLISIAAMMVAFSATFFIIFNDGLLRFAIAAAAISCLPVIVFVVLYWHFLLDIIRSAYRSRSLFQLNKPTLFSKED